MEDFLRASSQCTGGCRPSVSPLPRLEMAHQLNRYYSSGQDNKQRQNIHCSFEIRKQKQGLKKKNEPWFSRHSTEAVEVGDPGETATSTGVPDTVPVDYPMSLQPVVKAEPRKLLSGGRKTHSLGHGWLEHSGRGQRPPGRALISRVRTEPHKDQQNVTR